MIRAVESPAGEARIEAALAFLASVPAAAEVMVVGASREAADDLARRATVAAAARFGVHRASLAQLAARVAAGELTRLGLVPTTSLGTEALAARVTFEALGAHELRYFAPVARFPGFARALAGTLGECRLAGVAPDAIGAVERASTLAGTPAAAAADVGELLGGFGAALDSSRLADRATLFALATRVVASAAPGPLAVLPMVLLDVPIGTPAERAFVAALASRTPSMLITIPAGDDVTRAAVERLGARAERVTHSSSRRSEGGAAGGLTGPVTSHGAPSISAAPAAHVEAASALGHLRSYLFSETAPAEPAAAGEVVFFSAPGEGREAVEIVRRILEEARGGTRFDQMAVLLRAPHGYGSLFETAFGRARIPAYFARGARRPDPAGRALLALIECALEKLSARRFAEYLSLGQVPALDQSGAPPGRGAWAAADEEVLSVALDRLGEPALPEDESVAPATATTPQHDGARGTDSGGVHATDSDEVHGTDSDEVGGTGGDGVRKTNSDRVLGADRDRVREAGGDAPPVPAADDMDASPVVGGNLRAPWKWEQLIVESSVIGGLDRWRRRLAGLAAEMRVRADELRREEPDSVRAAAIDRDLANLDHLARFALPVVARLAALPRTATWGEWIRELEDLAPRVLRRPERVLGVLAELRALEPVGPVALDEVRDVLADQLATLAERPPASRYGCVFVGTLEQARGRSFDVVFIPGLAERIFPQKPREDPILLDELRRRLGADLQTQGERAQRERLLLQLGVGAARRRVHLSYSRIELAEGRPRVPSFYAMEVQRALTGAIPDPQTLERAATVEGGARLAWPAPNDPVRAIDEIEHDLASLGALLHEGAAARGRARYLLELNDRLARSLRTRWARWRPRFTPYDGIVQLAPGTQDALLASRPTARAYSVSALQRFAACPYQFYLSAIWRLEPRDDIAPLTRLDPLTRGSLFHQVQAECFRALQQSGALPLSVERVPEAHAVLDGVLARVAGEYHEKLAPAVERVWREEVVSLRVDLRTWLDRSAVEQVEWEPFAFELAFGLPRSAGVDAQSVRDEVTLEGGWRLRGIIDLLERRRDGTGLRVTDHKTGLNRAAVGLVVGKGEQLQPVLYGLAAEKILPEKVIESRLSYCTRAGEFSERVVKMRDDARRRGLEVLDLIDQAIARGFLPPAPRPRACDICDFRPVCGPGEERRIGHKDARSLADLSKLRDWR